MRDLSTQIEKFEQKVLSFIEKWKKGQGHEKAGELKAKLPDEILQSFQKLDDGDVKSMLLPIATSLRYLRAVTNSHKNYQATLKVILNMVLRKNKDYGDSVYQIPVLCSDITTVQAIRVRMSDKLNRLLNLKDKDPIIATESLADTVQDLIGYSFLWFTQVQKKAGRPRKITK